MVKRPSGQFNYYYYYYYLQVNLEFFNYKSGPGYKQEFGVLDEAHYDYGTGTFTVRRDFGGYQLMGILSHISGTNIYQFTAYLGHDKRRCSELYLSTDNKDLYKTVSI